MTMREKLHVRICLALIRFKEQRQLPENRSRIGLRRGQWFYGCFDWRARDRMLRVPGITGRAHSKQQVRHQGQ